MSDWLIGARRMSKEAPRGAEQQQVYSDNPMRNPNIATESATHYSGDNMRNSTAAGIERD